MLFNKNDNGTEELKNLIGFFYASNSFSNIQTDIMLAEEEMAELIGKELYDLADEHYNSEDYEGEDPEEETQLLDDLVHHIQLPVAYYAYKSFSANVDISHEDTGRRVKIDPEREKLAWEWMLEKDDQAVLNKAHKTTDRLIAWLEEHVEEIEEWESSDARKATLSLFINTAKDFDAIFPIDQSRRFFLKIVPFIREVERVHIKPVLGPDRFDEIKAAIEAGEFEDEDHILEYIKVPVALYAMSIAVKRLSIEVLPNGVFQNYVSDRLTQNAKNAAATDVRREVGQSLENDAKQQLWVLQEYLNKLNADDSGETYIPSEITDRMSEDNKFIRM